MRALLVISALSTAAYAATFAVCDGNEVVTDGSSALNACRMTDSETTNPFSTVTISNCKATSNVTITRTATGSGSRLIRIQQAPSLGIPGSDFGAALYATEPTCTNTLTVDGHGTLGLGTTTIGKVNTVSGTSVAICASSGSTPSPQGTPPGTAPCSGSTVPTNPVPDAAIFPYTCPSVTEVVDMTTVDYLRVNVDSAATASAIIPLVCAPATPPDLRFCARFQYCTPYTGAVNSGSYAGTCAASSADSQTQLLNACGAATSTAQYFPCSTTAGSSACATCSGVLNVNGMRWNSFEVKAAAFSQLERTIAAVRAGQVANVPPWATILTSEDGCVTTTPFPACASGTTCAFPGNDVLYPPAGLTNYGSMTVDGTRYIDMLRRYNTGGRSFSVGGKDGGSHTITMFPILSLVNNNNGGATRRRAAGALADPIDDLTNVGNIAPTQTTLASDCTTPECCTAFYRASKCNMNSPAFTSCACAGSTSCPDYNAIKCDNNGSNKSYLFLLFLLCIPFWLLILCSLIIACCMFHRRKQGWQERQLATFDPEPHPAAPPPPVNVYEECPAYGHHDGASGYSDVHHTNDEFYSAA